MVRQILKKLDSYRLAVYHYKKDDMKQSLETYGLMGADEGFYRGVELALIKGYKTLDRYLDIEPCRRYAKEQRFLDLLERYVPKERVLADNPK